MPVPSHEWTFASQMEGIRDAHPDTRTDICVTSGRLLKSLSRRTNGRLCSQNGMTQDWSVPRHGTEVERDGTVEV